MFLVAQVDAANKINVSATIIFQNCHSNISKFLRCNNENYVAQHLTAPYYEHFFTLKLK
jgi:hypothetical protein